MDGLEIDLAARVVRRDAEPVHLTPIEFDLLRVLVRNRGRLMTHRKLLAEVWGPEYVDDIQPLRTHIARLRAKIEPEGADGPALHRHRPGRGLQILAMSGPSGAGVRSRGPDAVAGRRAVCHGRHEIVMRARRSLCGRDATASIVLAMDVVAIVLGIVMFAILLLIIEGIDRV